MQLPVCRYCGSNDILEIEDASICRRIVGIDDDGTALLEAKEEVQANGGVTYQCGHCWRTMIDFMEIQPANPVLNQLIEVAEIAA